MRNLKKILALVLALVMSMSLMATANAFTDDANVDATYDEAVTVLSNLKVFQGYDDGSFQPKGSITRAEVAAIIYRIATGDVTDSQVGIYADYNKFDDVKSTSWYAGYVNYCANAEYIKGYDAKTFGPNDPVTGYQALAMILRAVGYDKNGEFTGANWQVQTASVGKQLHITDKVSAGTLGTAATREVVAEILFRSILVPQVTYTPALGYQSIGVSTSGNVWTGWFVDNASIGAETFGLAQTTGEITATNRKTGTTTLTPVVTRGNNDNVLDTANRADVINTDGNWENIGYVAYVYTVPTAGAKTLTAVSDVTVTGESMGVSTNGTTVQNLTSASSTSYIATVQNVRYYYNGVECTTNVDIKAAVDASQRVGVKVDIIDNDNGQLGEVIVITEYTTAYVSGIANTNNTGEQAVTYNAYNLTTADGSTRLSVAVKDTDLVCADTLTVGDLVTYVKYADDYYVVKAPLTTNTFTRINYNTVGSNNAISYVIGGTEYLVATWDVKENGASVAKTNLNSNNLSVNFNVYTDPYGHIIYAAPVAANVSYLYVLANDHTVATTGLTNAKVVNTDGTIGNVNIAKVPTGFYYANGEVAVNALQGRMFAYTVNTDGSYNLTGVCYINDPASYTKGTSTIYGAANLGVNTVTVVVDVRNVGINSTSATVYTGYGEIPSFAEGKLHYVTDANGWVKFAFLDDYKSLADEFIVYKTSYNYTEKVDGTQYYYLDVMKDGVKTENYQLTGAEYAEVVKYGVGVYSFKMNGELNEYTAFPEEWTTAIWQNGSIKTADGTYYTYDNTNVKFNVLNITTGTVNDYVMEYGKNYQAYLVKSNTAVKEIYIIVGNVAENAPSYRTEKQDNKDNGTYYYAVANGYVTNVLGFVADATAVPTVTLNGEKLTWASPLSATQFTAALSYEEWCNLPENSRFEVTPAPSNEIAVNNKLSFSDEVQYVAVTAKADGYQVITVYSQSKGAGEITESYTFTIYFAPAETGTVLTSEKKEVATIDQATKIITVVNDKLSIKEFKDNFEVSKNADVEWTFWNAQGIVTEDNYNQSMLDVLKFKAVVTAENGDTATYMDKNYANEIATSDLAAAKTEALAAVKAALEAALTEAGFDPEVALKDTTKFSFAGNSYALQEVLDIWNGAISNAATVEAVKTTEKSALDQVDALVNAYARAVAPTPVPSDIEVQIVGTDIYTANDDSATPLEIGAAVEAALIDAGYTDVDYKVNNQGVYGITAKKGGATVSFRLNPTGTDVTFLTEGESLDSAISGGAKTIFLATGTYSLNGMQLAGDVTIIGNGDVVIETGSGNGDAALKLGNGEQKLVIKGVTFKNTSAKSTAIAIQANGESAVSTCTFEISDCAFIGYTTAIQMINSVGGSITNCVFDNKMVDVSLSGINTQVTLSGNTYSRFNSIENIGVMKTDWDAGKIVINDAEGSYKLTIHE